MSKHLYLKKAVFVIYTTNSPSVSKNLHLKKRPSSSSIQQVHHLWVSTYTWKSPSSSRHLCNKFTICEYALTPVKGPSPISTQKIHHPWVSTNICIWPLRHLSVITDVTELSSACEHITSVQLWSVSEQFTPVIAVACKVILYACNRALSISEYFETCNRTDMSQYFTPVIMASSVIFQEWRHLSMSILHLHQSS